MASNFKITNHKKNGCLHIKLSGSFDGMAAVGLIYVLQQQLEGVNKVYVDTNGLDLLMPFGQMVFNNHFDFSTSAFRKMVFTGEYGDQICPNVSRHNHSR